MKASIDLLVDKLERQATRLQDKRRRGGGRAHDRGSAAQSASAGGAKSIVKAKQFAVKPMSADEAVLQLELIGHDFFVFRDDETGEVSVVYRRRDGDYGLIETHSG